MVQIIDIKLIQINKWSIVKSYCRITSLTISSYGLSANLKHQLSLVDCIIIQIVQLRFEFQVLQMLRHSDRTYV